MPYALRISKLRVLRALSRRDLEPSKASGWPISVVRQLAPAPASLIDTQGTKGGQNAAANGTQEVYMRAKLRG